MKEIMKIILSNWINVVSIFVVVYVAGFISAMVNDKFTFNQALFGTTYSVVVYGMIFWIGFFIMIAFLDVFLFSFNREPQYTNYKLAFEWLLISSPFIYWLIKYNQWIFLVAIIAFLIGQYTCEKIYMMIKILFTVFVLLFNYFICRKIVSNKMNRKQMILLIAYFVTIVFLNYIIDSVSNKLAPFLVLFSFSIFILNFAKSFVNVHRKSDFIDDAVVIRIKFIMVNILMPILITIYQIMIIWSDKLFDRMIS